MSLIRKLINKFINSKWHIEIGQIIEKKICIYLQIAPLQQGFWPDPCRANSGCIAWPRTGWEPAGLTRDQIGSSRELAESTQDEVHCQKLTGN